ncbi:MAG: hypothetical protein ACRDYV_01100 [Acidimicrobiia bacterium]
MEYEAGDVIVYRVFGGGLRRVLVEQRLADVKKGRPGFDGTVISGPEKGQAVWGYDHQIVPLQVIESAPERRARRSGLDDSSPGAA